VFLENVVNGSKKKGWRGWLRKPPLAHQEGIRHRGGDLVGLVVGIISADQSIKIGPIDVGIDEDFIHSQLRSRLP
jgi:hypothetical protein